MSEINEPVDTIKSGLQKLIGSLGAGALTAEKELAESYANEDGTGTAESFEIRAAYEAIMDGLAVFTVYIDKL